jgi:uncharacterized iron-regulated membrane protein
MTGPILCGQENGVGEICKQLPCCAAGHGCEPRDWNWHNALGFWCVVPLFLIVVTGVIMSYGWANSLLYRITGNEPPIQSSPAPLRPPTGPTRFYGLDKRFARARLQVPGWTAISVRLQDTPEGVLTFSIDQGNGGRPDLRSQLMLDASAALVRWEPFSSYNRGRQLRSWARFTHTGEAFGSLGQTAAATASAGASLLVMTGLSLAFRRLASRRSKNRERETDS